MVAQLLSRARRVPVALPGALAATASLGVGSLAAGSFGISSAMVVALGLSLGLGGCNADPHGRTNYVADSGDPGNGGNGDVDLLPGPLNLCGDHDPTCTNTTFGPPARPFPLSSDPQPDPNVTDNGVDRDPDGYLILGATRATFDFVWIANSEDWGRGTVAKINSKTVREVARYESVTCFSNAAGSKAGCDGTKGCCSRDDNDRFVARNSGQPATVHQPVQLSANNPSRTTVDFNGDVWVANRAFGGQSSVTKIANDLSECIDRNGTPGIQTSSDVNGDGVIDTDCNRNNAPDDLDDVKATPCVNGKPQEFFGLDDECILFTTNTNVVNQYGRPLALGRGAADTGPADAWAGTYLDGKFFRVDGTTGQIKAQAKVPVQPYGAAIDAKGILWAGGVTTDALTYFDTGNPAASAAVRAPVGFNKGGYGIGLDRDQNIWLGGYPEGHAFRYTPKRGGTFADLGQGFWTKVSNPGLNHGASGCAGRGIAADSRTPTTYFVWMACNGAPYIVRINASAIPLPVGMDVTIPGEDMPAIQVAGGTICGAGVDVQQNIWGIASGGAVATRIKIDMNGGLISAPDIAGGTDNAGCPVGAGDRCTLGLTGVNSNPGPYTYSDFTGFGLRNFTNPKGSYSYVVRGCGPQVQTRWQAVLWDGATPANTTLSARVRTGDVPYPDNSWGTWTNPVPASPDDVSKVMPNPAQYLQVEFDLSTTDRAATPRLKGFTVAYECGGPPG